jgi:hypothetical protein
MYHWVFLHVSKDHSILLLYLLDLKDESITILLNIKHHSPNDTVPHLRRFESSAPPMWKLKFFILNCQKCALVHQLMAMYVFYPKMLTTWTGKRCHSPSYAGLPATEVQEVLCRNDPRAAVLWPLPYCPWSMCRCVDIMPARLAMIHVLLC